MTVEGHISIKDSRVAASDLSAKQYYFVKLTATGQVDACTAATDKPYGILQNKPTSGKLAEILVSGISKASAGGAVTAGTSVTITANGQVAVGVQGTDLTKYILGQARSTAAALNEIMTVVVNCASAARGA